MTRLFRVAAATSLVLCAAVVVSWVRVRKSERVDRLGLGAPSGRLLLRADRAGLTLIQSPSAVSAVPGEVAQVAQFAARMRNADIGWRCYQRLNSRGPFFGINESFVFPEGLSLREAGEVSRDYSLSAPNPTRLLVIAGTVGLNQRPLSLDALRAPLLQALADPDRFVAAHVLLHYVFPHGTGERREATEETRVEGESTVRYVEKLRVEIPPPVPGVGPEPEPSGIDPDTLAWAYYLHKPRFARVDPTQMIALRTYWTNRFDERLGSQIVSVGHGWVVAGMAVCPVACFVMWVRTVVLRCRRSRHGQCVDCGYDLRWSNGRCPECGMTKGTPLAADTPSLGFRLIR